jgi:hypothetical protein
LWQGIVKIMWRNRRKRTAVWLIAGAVLGSATDLIYQSQATGQTPAPPPQIPPEHFAKLHRLIKPGPGELRFHEIPWRLDITQARKQAAAQGRPILVWSGAGGAPIGIC